MDFAKQSSILLFLLSLPVCFLSSNTCSGPALTSSLYEDDNSVRILIDGNENFTMTANQQGWLGDGTKSSPFQIKNLTINLAFELEIRNTTLYFQFSDNTIATNERNEEIYFALWLENVSNAEVSGNRISGFLNDPPILISGSQDILLNGNEIIHSGGGGIDLFNSRNILLRNNLLANHDEGILAHDSDNITIIDNTFQNHSEGFRFVGDFNSSQIVNNDFINSTLATSSFINFPFGFRVNFTGNTVNGKILLVWVNQSNKIVPENAGQVILINSSYIEVSNQQFTSCGLFASKSSHLLIHQNAFEKTNMDALSLENTNFSVIANNSIKNSRDSGFSAVRCFNNSLLGNSFSLNNRQGIEIFSSSNLHIKGNKMDQNGQTGISLTQSHENTIESNSITRNKHHGVALEWSNENVIASNQISHNHWNGIELSRSYSNHITENQIFDNEKKDIDADSDQNTIINNTTHGKKDDSTPIPFWPIIISIFILGGFRLQRKRFY